MRRSPTVSQRERNELRSRIRGRFQLGFRLLRRLDVATARWRRGENHDARVPTEAVLLLAAP